jgi:hypothetical protein
MSAKKITRCQIGSPSQTFRRGGHRQESIPNFLEGRGSIYVFEWLKHQLPQNSGGLKGMESPHKAGLEILL